MKKSELELIFWLQNWYSQYCDGDWEHNENINIHTIDNPGWRITINLEGTLSENKSFKSIKKETSNNEWYHCFLRNGNFEGAGGPSNLIDILYVFKNWVENDQKESLPD